MNRKQTQLAKIIITVVLLLVGTVCPGSIIIFGKGAMCTGFEYGVFLTMGAAVFLLSGALCYKMWVKG